MADGYPMILSLVGRLVVVVGAGGVGLRKVRGLLAGGADRVRVVAPAIHPEMPADVERVNESYHPKHLKDASLVFAATNSPDINRSIVENARKIGALACRADVEHESGSDFSTPAVLRTGEMLITVSTGGNPALSALVRDRIESMLDPRLIAMAGAMQTLRPIIRVKLAAERRPAAFRALASDKALNELSVGGEIALRKWLVQQFPELHD
jgi:precorrin-2 dehydrogenase/sirohydrochlorin ferrochelatase